MSRGIVKVTNDRNKLRLVLPVNLSLSVYGIKQKRIALGLDDTPENRRLAQAKADLIQSDITFERFDHTLEKYGLGKGKSGPVEAKPLPKLTVLQLWDKYVKYKSSTIKAGTLGNYELIRRIIIKVGDTGDDAIAFRTRALGVTSTQWAKRTFMMLAACHRWGIKHGLIASNPFEGMAKELPRNKYEVNPQPNPFTQPEKQNILNAFASHRLPGGAIGYSYYLPFVRFLFLTGCRPSEAIGLQWKHIADDFGKISFETSITYIPATKKQVRNQGSKNNRNRIFRCNSELSQLLQSIKPEKFNLESLVFPSPEGKPINYNNFSRRAWDKIVDPIKTGTTPYCCRDTFISEQITKGIPAAIVAKWVDNSVKMIEKYYLGDTENVMPL